MNRRDALLSLGAVVVLPAHATSSEMEAAIRGYADGKPVTRGKVKLDVPPLVENGNAVPITVSVDSPMTPEAHVTGIAVFNDRNPQRDVVRFTLTPRSGRAQVSTRIRLATSQQLVAVARLSDGSYWSDAVDVLVTLAACLE
ncbi:MAG: SoxY-related AACIE arm protein [Rhizobacter sp.]|nr:SoxY-related AACIE arm protein [Rhizobacter sp.]